MPSSSRSTWSSWLDGLRADLRYALRTLRRSPGFCATAMVILGLGIGANTTMFSAVNTVLLRPLSYADAERLVVILHHGRGPVAPANFLDWRAQSRAYARMGAAEYWTPNFNDGDRAERVYALRLTEDVLPLLGVPPLLGRVFSAEEVQTGDTRKVVIGHALWQRRFGGDPRVVGRSILLDGDRYDVIGVMPPQFAFAPFWATRAEIWAPMSLAERQANRGGNSLRVFARLAPGVTLAQAQAEMNAVTARLEQMYPGTNRAVQVLSLQEKVVGQVRLTLLVLLGAVGFVLLIACANVAHMLLARAAARQREVAVRLALGATRLQIVRQHLVESVVLSALSGIVGFVLAIWGVRTLAGLTPGDLPRIGELAIDGRVLAFTIGVSLLTGVLFGLMPAWQARAVSLRTTLADGGRGSIGTRRGSRLRDLLVVSEYALAIVLLVGAGLMIRSIAALQRIDAGFDPRGVLSLHVSVKGSAQEDPARRAAFFRETLTRLRALPGVEAAGAINHLPIGGDLWGRSFTIDGRPIPKPGDEPGAAYRVVMPGYFETMRLPIVRGRGIAESDTLGTPRVVVINEYLARRHFPDQDAIGQRIALSDGPSTSARDWLTIVGVVKNAAIDGWNDDQWEEIYLSHTQTREYLDDPAGRFAYMTVVVRAAGDPAALAPSAREAIWSIDRAVALADVETMEAVVGRSLARPRFQVALLGAFAGLALLLAAAGIYGVMSYAIARRTHEIGLRMTLGAQRRDVLRMVIGQAMVRVAIGTAIGVAGALLLTRLMTSLLFHVRPTDPLTFGVVSLVLIGAALLASYIPARRATRIDPMTALRQS